MQYHSFRDENHITCLLCKHYCVIRDGKHGICGINYNHGGELVNITYNHPSTINLDPIEKKPLYHFLPNSTSLSLGTVGCNFRCPFCQNHSISQTTNVDKSIFYTPRDIVDLALSRGAKSISYTYNEPTIWYQYAKDIGVLAKEAGLKNIFVSSGYESHEVLADMHSWLDGINVDLKSFDEEYYKKVLKTALHGVLDSLVELAKSPIHLEITTLLIPQITLEQIEQMAEFIALNLGLDIPWHFSAFFPNYKMLDDEPTLPEMLLKAVEIARSYGIRYIYLGNVRYPNETRCYSCDNLLIDRAGYSAKIVGLDSGKCSRCGSEIAGVWSSDDRRS